jgi:hypothetical protein
VGRTRKNKESATFEYDKTWLENPARFSLEPALQAGPAPFHTPAAYKGFPHGMPTTDADTINADLLTFLKGAVTTAAGYH